MKRDAHNLTFDELSSELSLPRNSIPVLRVRLIKDRTHVVKSTMSQVEDVVTLLSEYLSDGDREHFVVLMLDVKNQVIGLHTAIIGTLDCALVCPRDVFKAAILPNAASIIVAHNHPSGDPTPSPEDFDVTEKLASAGALLGIRLLDHVVIGET